jgi:penicillin-binding protein 1A
MTDTLYPIKTLSDYQAALIKAESLMDAPEHSDENRILAILTVLIADFERAGRATPAPLDVVLSEITLNGRNQKELADVLGSRSRASEVLSGRRPISPAMADKIAAAWSLPRTLLGPATAKASVPNSWRVGAATSVAALVISGMLTWQWAIKDLPSIAPLVTASETQPVPTPLAAIPIHVRQAFLAAEDADFYAQDGHSLRGIARASFKNMAVWHHQGRWSGGTGITEQLVKNTLLKGQPKSLKRRIQQFVLARNVEKALSKDAILERYLNEISFGGKAIGIGGAANTYFNTAPADLNVAQAALLAGMPAAPNTYRIDRADNLPRAKWRRTWVIERMSDEGFITASVGEQAKAFPLQ